MTPRFEFDGPNGKELLEVAGQVNYYKLTQNPDIAMIDVGDISVRDDLQAIKNRTWGKQNSANDDKKYVVKVESDKGGPLVVNGEIQDKVELVTDNVNKLYIV